MEKRREEKCEVRALEKRGGKEWGKGVKHKHKEEGGVNAIMEGINRNEWRGIERTRIESVDSERGNERKKNRNWSE